MHKFLVNLVTEWRKLGLPFSGGTVVTAVSGGADSLALLLALDELRKLKKLDLRIVAAHFNHKLRGRESDADEEFVRGFAAEREIELAVGHGSISKEGNLEQNARDARYEFLAGTAESVRSGWVLTAHTLNDQAETFLLNLIRGSGPDGLSGMKAIRALAPTAKRDEDGNDGKSPLPSVSSPPLPSLSSALQLARPLLRWARREDTENFCRGSRIEFRYDTMNEDMSFKRVRVRKMLLPMLKEFNPNIIETLARTAELMGPPRVGTEGENPVHSAAELVVADLKMTEVQELRDILRSWLKGRRGDLRGVSLKHIEAVERLIFSTKSGRIVELPGHGSVRKQNGRLRFEIGGSGGNDRAETK